MSYLVTPAEAAAAFGWPWPSRTSSTRLLRLRREGVLPGVERPGYGGQGGVRYLYEPVDLAAALTALDAYPLDVLAGAGRRNDSNVSKLRRFIATCARVNPDAAYVILHHGNRPWVHPARMPMSAGCLDAARICGGLTTIVPMRRSSEVAQAARVTA